MSSQTNVDIVNPTTEAPAGDVSQSATGDEKREWPWRKAKKVAVMLSFSGKDYLGMQRNIGLPTIEEELLKAFHKSGSIAPEWFENPQKGFFQRASRTDKGVSAAKMVISLKMLHEKNTVDDINKLLPSEIKVHSIKRVTKNFNSKNSCDARTYLYLTPTLAFCPVENIVNEEFRITPEIRDSVTKVLNEFIGAHYFHNYTSGKLPLEPSSQRYITKFEMGEPFVRSGVEFAMIQVKGQSFMLHQIRKMIGMAIAIVRGHASMDVLKLTWNMERIDVPRAPGLGLLLEEVHYEKYNKKFGNDGMHEALTWEEVHDQVESFKEDYIFSDIVNTEIQEKSMLTWMENLPIHTFQPRHFESTESENSPLRLASKMAGYKTNKEGEIVNKKTKDQDDDDQVDETISNTDE